jgi:multiple antibiotic resistance protein
MDASIFLKAFVALFVAIDPLAALPFLAGLTQNMRDAERRSLIYRATGSALAIGLVFIFAGRAIFNLLGITESDFRVAGGLLLIIFAIHDLLSSTAVQGVQTPKRVGIVPIAVPLMMGPAALTTLMIGVEQYGILMVVLSLVLNLLIVWQLFKRAEWITHKVGQDAGEAINKVFSLLLAAIGVMLVRSGIVEMLHL